MAFRYELPAMFFEMTPVERAREVQDALARFTEYFSEQGRIPSVELIAGMHVLTGVSIGWWAQPEHVEQIARDYSMILYTFIKAGGEGALTGVTIRDILRTIGDKIEFADISPQDGAIIRRKK